MQIPYNSVIVSWEFISENWKLMFTYTAALFCNSQDQELPRQSLTNKLWNMHTMEILTTQQWKETNYWYIWQPGWYQELKLGEKKPIPKGYLLYNSIYTFSKWQNYRKGEWISGCQMLRRKCVGEKAGVFIKGNMKGIFTVMGMYWILPVSVSKSWLWCCYLSFARRLWEEMRNRHAVSPYYFLQLQVSLQLSQN